MDKLIIDPYCYPQTNVLINNRAIKDKETLDKVERAITNARLLELKENPIEGNFDTNHLKSIHRYLFQDIYPFAGELRTCNIRRGTMALYDKKYSDKNSIETDLLNLFIKMRIEINNIETKEQLPYFLSDILIELNHIHPFREGNGRTEREFIREYIINLRKIERFSDIQLNFSNETKARLGYGLTIDDKDILIKEFRIELGLEKHKTI